MVYTKIFNPITKRNISIFSKKGNEILYKYLDMVGGANPSNNCIKGEINLEKCNKKFPCYQKLRANKRLWKNTMTYVLYFSYYVSREHH